MILNFTFARTTGMLLTALVGLLTLTPAPVGGQLVPVRPGLDQLGPLRDTVGIAVDTAGEETSSRWSSPRAVPTTLLDGPISRTEYVLGPGDVLTLAIFGFRSELFTLDVSPEQTVVVPGVGVVSVAGLSIADAERQIARAVRRVYRDVEVNLTLASVRSFKVFVVGEVPEAGSRTAAAVTRVSEVVPHADEEDVIHRNVSIRRANGEVRVADLAVFLQTGDMTHNPILREGDIIQVPTIDETVTVTGRVAFPGTYAFRSGDTLADIIRIANGGGPFPASAADTIRLMRFSEDPRGRIMTVARDAAVGEAGTNTFLAPFDAIFVPRIAHFGRQTTATVEGEVVRPGEYPIRPGTTTVRELVEMAGGFTADASLLDATLRRQPVELPRDSVSPLRDLPPELLTRQEQRVLQVTSRADDRNVVVDFRRLFEEEGSAYDLPLQHRDHLYVPEYRSEVTVLGAVIQPGILAYVPGQPIDYFIELAGGYSQRADRNDVVVLKARLGNRLQREDVMSLEPGDQIIVPFREPRTFMERLQTANGVLSTISGLVLTVVGLERIFDMVAN